MAAPKKAPKNETAAAETAAAKGQITVPSFTQVERPATQRAPKENPYAAAIAALASDVDDDGMSKSATNVQVPGTEADTHIRLAQKAGRTAGVTVRQQRTNNEDGSVSLTFWTVPQITRKRGEKDNDES